jgi:hypothetical protein
VQRKPGSGRPPKIIRKSKVLLPQDRLLASLKQKKQARVAGGITPAYQLATAKKAMMNYSGEGETLSMFGQDGQVPFSIPCPTLKTKQIWTH